MAGVLPQPDGRIHLPGRGAKLRLMAQQAPQVVDRPLDQLPGVREAVGP